MAARGLLHNPAMFAGYDVTPLRCIRDWTRIAMMTGTPFNTFHHHLIYMCEAALSRYNAPPAKHLCLLYFRDLRLPLQVRAKIFEHAWVDGVRVGLLGHHGVCCRSRGGAVSVFPHWYLVKHPDFLETRNIPLALGQVRRQGEVTLDPKRSQILLVPLRHSKQTLAVEMGHVLKIVDSFKDHL